MISRRNLYRPSVRRGTIIKAHEPQDGMRLYDVETDQGEIIIMVEIADGSSMSQVDAADLPNLGDDTMLSLPYHLIGHATQGDTYAHFYGNIDNGPRSFFDDTQPAKRKLCCVKECNCPDDVLGRHLVGKMGRQIVWTSHYQEQQGDFVLFPRPRSESRWH